MLCHVALQGSGLTVRRAGPAAHCSVCLQYCNILFIKLSLNKNKYRPGKYNHEIMLFEGLQTLNTLKYFNWGCKFLGFSFTNS